MSKSIIINGVEIIDITPEMTDEENQEKANFIIEGLFIIFEIP